MPTARAKRAPIPPHIEKAHHEYGFQVKLETAVVTASRPGWFYILYRNYAKDQEPFYAVSFREGENGWEVWNDFHSFETEADFETETARLASE